MNHTARFLYLVLITLCLSYPAQNEAATPGIDIVFENSSATGPETIHARAEFYSYGPEIRTTLAAITGYPELHAWISNTTLLRHVNARKLEYLVEFDFPWPVGRRWSRVGIPGKPDKDFLAPGRGESENQPGRNFYRNLW